MNEHHGYHFELNGLCCDTKNKDNPEIRVNQLETKYRGLGRWAVPVHVHYLMPSIPTSCHATLFIHFDAIALWRINYSIHRLLRSVETTGCQ